MKGNGGILIIYLSYPFLPPPIRILVLSPASFQNTTHQQEPITLLTPIIRKYLHYAFLFRTYRCQIRLSVFRPFPSHLPLPPQSPHQSLPGDLLKAQHDLETKLMIIVTSNWP